MDSLYLLSGAPDPNNPGNDVESTYTLVPDTLTISTPTWTLTFRKAGA